jgi:dissimilatory sulfite reductase (desulfoviridin) alpha/beta subunit
VFRDLGDDSVGGTLSALAHEPGTVVGSLVQNPDVDAVMSAVNTILDFKTQAVRDIEAGRIKSIIDPRLADHVRREALKFLNELKRAV